MNNLKFLTILFLLLTTSTFSQTRLPGSGSGSSSNEGTPVDFSTEQQLKKDIDDVGLTVANKLMRCCSSFGGNNLYSKVDYENVRQNQATGAFTIPMQIGWYGSLSGNHYWIKGKLTVYSNGSKEWLKIRDSGGFNPGCSKDCIH